MRVLVIANPIAGIRKDRRAVLDAVRKQLTRRGHSCDITFSMARGRGKYLSSRAVVEGYDAVFAAGGDGTVNDVASGLVDRHVPLGVLPLGTGNGLARGLNIPFEYGKTIDLLEKEQVRAIDVGKIGQYHFLATGGIGFDAQIAHEFNLQQTTQRSMTRYFTIGLKNYLFRGSEEVEITIDGNKMTRKIFAMTFANTPQYGGGAIIAPTARPDSGKLVAVLIPKPNIIQGISGVIKLFKGTVDEIKILEYIEFTKMSVKRQKNDFLHVDGEAYNCNQQFTVQVNPSSLMIISE